MGVKNNLEVKNKVIFNYDSIRNLKNKLSLRRAHHSKRVVFYTFDFQMDGNGTRFAMR